MEIKESLEPIKKRPKKPCNTGKYHVTENLPALVEELKEKYSLTRWTSAHSLVKNVPREDVEKIFDLYATDLRVDSYTIAECFNCSANTLDKLIAKEEYKELWESAKRRRGALYLRTGYEIATTPFQMAMHGEQISSALVASAKVASNYSLLIGQSLNSDFAPKRASDGANGGEIHVTVNTGFQLKI